MPQRFWLPKEGRMLHADGINFNQKLVSENGNPKRYSFATGKNPDVIMWLMPTLKFDKNNKMIYEHDIIMSAGEHYRILFSKSEWWMVNKNDAAYRLASIDSEIDIKGNMFESASLMEQDND